MYGEFVEGVWVAVRNAIVRGDVQHGSRLYVITPVAQLGEYLVHAATRGVGEETEVAVVDAEYGEPVAVCIFCGFKKCAVASATEHYGICLAAAGIVIFPVLRNVDARCTRCRGKFPIDFPCETAFAGSRENVVHLIRCKSQSLLGEQNYFVHVAFFNTFTPVTAMLHARWGCVVSRFLSGVKSMTKLSVNINKIAVIRNSRGGNMPDVIEAARRIEGFGAQGITVHPRPDERHIRYNDVRELRKVVTTELNVEGNPFDSFTDLVMEVVPTQVTLVPDSRDAITSNAGWDTVKYRDFLREKAELFHSKGIRVSVFVNPDPAMVRGAVECGADRVELYTEAYASAYGASPEAAIRDYVAAAEEARRVGLGLNAGHDLNLDNLRYFISRIPFTDEVSIGHALISDALYYGLEKTVAMYLDRVKG